MAKEIKVWWNYSETSGYDEHLGDVQFYRSLPGMAERIRTSDGRIPMGGPDPQSIIYWGGSAILSSSILAAAIKAYVVLKKRKVVISVGNKKLEYEGSDLEHDQKAIEAMIDKLSDEEGTTSLKIYAE
jgi:hypothetical protein